MLIATCKWNERKERVNQQPTDCTCNKFVPENLRPWIYTLSACTECCRRQDVPCKCQCLIRDRHGRHEPFVVRFDNRRGILSRVPVHCVLIDSVSLMIRRKPAPYLPINCSTVLPSDDWRTISPFGWTRLQELSSRKLITNSLIEIIQLAVDLVCGRQNIFFFFCISASSSLSPCQ